VLKEGRVRGQMFKGDGVGRGVGGKKCYSG